MAVQMPAAMSMMCWRVRPPEMGTPLEMPPSRGHLGCLFPMVRDLRMRKLWSWGMLCYAGWDGCCRFRFRFLGLDEVFHDRVGWNCDGLFSDLYLSRSGFWHMDLAHWILSRPGNANCQRHHRNPRDTNTQPDSFRKHFRMNFWSATQVPGQELCLSLSLSFSPLHRSRKR